MTKAGVADPSAYAAVLAHDPEALDGLLAELTVGETYFFRDPAQFEFIRAEILPEIRRRRGAEHVLRTWCAGCASGEEPYSLAVVCHEAALADRSHILATDISRRALTNARKARYREWSLRGDGAHRVRPYLTRAAGESADPRQGRYSQAEYQMDERIRRLVAFEYLNLALDVYPSTITGTRDLDLILCRNVLIYFDRATVLEVAQRFFESLAPGGWLVTGASDPPLRELAPLATVVTNSGVFYRRPAEPMVMRADESVEAPRGGGPLNVQAAAGPSSPNPPEIARFPRVAGAAGSRGMLRRGWPGRLWHVSRRKPRLRRMIRWPRPGANCWRAVMPGRSS